MDGLYFRVSSQRQTTENQFADLLQVAEKDGSRCDWSHIHEALSRCVIEEPTATARTVQFRIRARMRNPDRQSGGERA